MKLQMLVCILKQSIVFFGPFMLNKPGGLKWSKTVYGEGGETGNREDHINEQIIDKMNQNGEKCEKFLLVSSFIQKFQW